MRPFVYLCFEIYLLRDLSISLSLCLFVVLRSIHQSSCQSAHPAFPSIHSSTEAFHPSIYLVFYLFPLNSSTASWSHLQRQDAKRTDPRFQLWCHLQNFKAWDIGLAPGFLPPSTWHDLVYCTWFRILDNIQEPLAILDTLSRKDIGLLALNWLGVIPDWPGTWFGMSWDQLLLPILWCQPQIYTPQLGEPPQNIM